MSHPDPASEAAQSLMDAAEAWMRLAEMRERENATLRARVVELEAENARLIAEWENSD